MGLITSRFRDNKSTIEILETIEKDISRLQRSRRQNQERQKKVAASLLLYSVLLYIVAALVFYFFYFPDTWKDRALYSLPLLVFPVLVWGTRKIMQWYFVKRLSANDLAVNELREKKKLILEDVMEKETYKKAKEILEKFDPTRFKKLEKTESPGAASGTPGTAVRQRVIVQPVQPTVMTPAGPRPRAMHPPSAPHWGTKQQATPGMRPITPVPTPRPGMPPYRYSPPPGPPMPRSVLPKDRGAMEKLIDFVVGDGPQNRYALICNICKSHNGMALPEEFEYLSFRCCYCYNMNQARKMRPFAPRLEFPETPTPAKPASESGTPGTSKDKEVNGKTVQQDTTASSDSDDSPIDAQDAAGSSEQDQPEAFSSDQDSPGSGSPLEESMETDNQRQSAEADPAEPEPVKHEAQS